MMIQKLMRSWVRMQRWFIQCPCLAALWQIDLSVLERAIIFGGILMTIGHLVLALPNDWSFFYGMAFIICGNGFFKPNISSLVGTLYSKNDPRRDSGFSMLYMGINIGAALGGALCAYVGTEINWHYGFGLAGIFMLIGLIVFVIGKKSLGERGLPLTTLH
ncbi:MAG: MFS transporter [Chitinophagaceae bacterium]